MSSKRAWIGGVVVAGLAGAALIALLRPEPTRQEQEQEQVAAWEVAPETARPPLRALFAPGPRTPQRAEAQQRTLRRLLLELAAADRTGRDADRDRLLAELSALPASGWAEVLGALTQLRDATTLQQALRLIAHRLPRLQELFGAELAIRLRPLLRSALTHEGDAALCGQALALWADVDPPGFRLEVRAAAARPSAGLGLIEGVIATFERLPRSDQPTVLGGLATAQLTSTDLGTGLSPLESSRRRDLALGAARALLQRSSAGELRRVLEDDGESEVRATVAAAAADAGRLRLLVRGPDAARLGATLRAEVVERARSLTPEQPVPPATERRLRTLAALPLAEGRAALLDLIAAEPRVDLSQVSARLLVSMGGKGLPATILERMRSAAPTTRARLDLGEALLSLESLSPGVRASCRDLLAESSAFGPEKLKPRALALVAAAESGEQLGPSH